MIRSRTYSSYSQSSALVFNSFINFESRISLLKYLWCTFMEWFYEFVIDESSASCTTQQKYIFLREFYMFTPYFLVLCFRSNTKLSRFVAAPVFFVFDLTFESMDVEIFSFYSSILYGNRNSIRFSSSPRYRLES